VGRLGSTLPDLTATIVSISNLRLYLPYYNMPTLAGVAGPFTASLSVLLAVVASFSTALFLFGAPQAALQIITLILAICNMVGVCYLTLLYCPGRDDVPPERMTQDTSTTLPSPWIVAS
jgi:dolichol kinase